jgi:hypothetical protein
VHSLTRTKVFAFIAAIFLLVSVGINIYQYQLYVASNNENNQTLARLDMQDILGHVQSEVNLQLGQLDHSMLVACSQLATTDLKGVEARAILFNLAANSSFIVNACTSDLRDIILAVEPSQYSSIEGEDISGQEQNLMLHETLRPVMSTMILLVEGFYGVVMVAPIFDANQALVGALSIVIQPYELLKAAIGPNIDGTPFAMWTMQTNGTLLYDPDPVQQGKNLFTDPIYQDYPTVQAFAAQVTDNADGYGTYQYHENTVTGKVVNKEAYWTSVGVYGTEWRLVILNVLNP